jgi:hypothetical protein
VRELDDAIVGHGESWRAHYNAVRSHASLDYKPPAPDVFFLPAFTVVQLPALS